MVYLSYRGFIIELEYIIESPFDLRELKLMEHLAKLLPDNLDCCLSAQPCVRFSSRLGNNLNRILYGGRNETAANKVPWLGTCRENLGSFSQKF